MTQYRLVPILAHMGACPESLAWLEEKKFPTAREAFEAHDDYVNLLWLCDDEYRDGFLNPPKFSTGRRRYLDDEYKPDISAEKYRARLAQEGLTFEKLEKLLYEYGEANGCLVPVEPSR